MKLKITKERFNQIVQEEHQRIQEEKEETEVHYHQGFPLEPGETRQGFKDAVGRERANKKALSQSQMKQFVRINPGLKEEEHAEPVGAGIEDISADDVVGTQPGLGFDVGSQEAFTQVFTKFRKRDGTLDYFEIMKVYEELDEKNKKEFVEFILRNPLIFNNMKQSDVDFALDLDPDAPLDIDMSDYEQGAPESKEEEEEDMDSLVKEIQNLLKQQGNL